MISNTDDTEVLEDILKLFLHENKDITHINFCTIDGFFLGMAEADHNAIEKDKMSAISSTLCSLSNSAVSEIIGQGLDVCSIESGGASIILVRVEYKGTECVLTVVNRDSITLGEARYKTKKLSEIISKYF